MDKHHIISEIKRTASENGGIALGTRKFSATTGIKEYAWKGKYWRSWSDALKEAGLSGNTFNVAHDKDFLVACLIKIMQKTKKFPAEVDIKLARGSDDTIPSAKSFRKLGTQSNRVEFVRKYAMEHEGLEGIVELLPPPKDVGKVPDKEVLSNTKIKEAFVYLGVLKIDTKKRYKIGKTNLVERRNAELSLQLPEKLELVHYIRTDDMSGIEAYWHKRFADKNTNGEWFDLSSEDVRAFKLRKFM